MLFEENDGESGAAMLPYVKNYALIAYILSIVVPIGLITAASWLTGFYLPSSIPGIIVSVALLAACLLAAKNISNRLANAKVEQMLSLYNDACDPQAFVVAGRDVAARIQPPYEENGSWFLSFYALALDDAGQREEAVRIGQAMLSSAQRTVDPQMKVSLLVNIEPLVQRLFGANQALEVVEAAFAAISESGVPMPEQTSFLEWERGTLQAVRDGKDDVLVSRFSSVRVNPTSPMRLRVSDALLEAALHKARGEAADERTCLEFVVANGNKLPAVALAKERLAAL